MTKKQISYKTMIVLLLIGVLLFSSSVMSQSLVLEEIISPSVNLAGYILPGIVVFLWGASSKFLS